MHDKKFSIKHIAAQAAVSVATVDRVINKRSGVRAYTAQRVLNAINELEDQSTTVKLTVKKNYIDIIMQTPSCYSNLIKESVLRTLPSMQNLNISPRFHFFENENVETITNSINRIIKNGTHGLVIKTTNDQSMRSIINYAYKKNIPTITFCTDIRQSKRINFIGIDHYSAGQSAGYITGNWLKKQNETILISISNSSFLNEAEREMGFRQTLRQRFPNLHINTLSGGAGLYEKTYDIADEYLKNGGKATAIYSVGGGNAALLNAFKKHNRSIGLFIGHDLDETNKLLLKENKIHVVLDNNRERDIRHAFLQILKFHGQVKCEKPFTQSRTNIITPFNI